MGLLLCDSDLPYTVEHYVKWMHLNVHFKPYRRYVILNLSKCMQKYLGAFCAQDDMMTWSKGNKFRVTGPLWGNPTVIGGFSSQRPVTQRFDIFFDLHLNKRLGKQSGRQWFQTPSRLLWNQCNLERKEVTFSG